MVAVTRRISCAYVFFVLVIGYCNLALAATAPQVSTLPLTFEKNLGQAAPEYSYVLRRGGMEAMFDRGGVDFSFSGHARGNERLRLRLMETDAAPVGAEALDGRSNYLIGADESRWIKSVPQFGRVEYRELYPGISLGFYGNGGELEHDFVVSAGADASRIAFKLEGAERVELSAGGELEVHLAESTLTLRRLVAYQDLAGGRRKIEAGFVLAKDGTVRFKLGEFDSKYALVIDPVFTFSSYLGGTGADRAEAVTTDSSGNIYVTGSTTSSDFPTAHPEQSTFGGCNQFAGCQNAFVTKFDPTGAKLIYSTYLGGSGTDDGGTIAVDGSGNAIVGGISSSSDFPLAGGIQKLSCQINGYCYFLASLSADGSKLNYSGLIGGGQGNYTNGLNGRVAVDALGNAYLAGVTDYSNFQITPGTLTSTVPGYPNNNMFVLKVDGTGSLVYSTIVPGNAPPNPASVFTNFFLPYGMSVNSAGEVTAAGFGGQGLPTTAGVISTAFPNPTLNYEDPIAGFVLQLNATASAIKYATYLPGVDRALAMTSDASGNTYTTGITSETTLPVSADAYLKTLTPGTYCTCNAGWVMKLNPTGTSVLAATYLSGTPPLSNEGTGFSAIAVDSHGNVFLGGDTGSPDFPLVDPFVTALNFSTTATSTVIAEMNPSLSSLLLGSFLSSTSFDAGSNFSALAVDPSGNLIVTGTTYATDFPTTKGSFEPRLPPPASQFSTPAHTFVTKIDVATPAPSVCFDTTAIAFGMVKAGVGATQTLKVTNCGNATLDISSIVASVPQVTASQNCSTVAAGATCLLTVMFTPKDDSQVNGTLTFADNAVISPQVVSFSGQGIAPQLEVQGSSIAFGRQLVGVQGPTSGVFIGNIGSAPLVVSSISVTGSSFVLVSDTGCVGTLTARYSCFIGVAFAPQAAGDLTGSLVIASNDPDSAQTTIALTGTGDSQLAVPVVSSISPGTVLINGKAVTVQVTGTGFYPQSVVEVNGVAQTTTYDSNTFLSASVAASSLTGLGELALTVVNPAPGGGVSAPVVLTPYESLGIGAVAVASVPAMGLLYAAIPANATANANTVLPVDPVKGTIGAPIAVGSDPRLLAASEDGAYLYVANRGDMTLQRINLKTNKIERTFPYAPNAFCSSCTPPGETDLRVVPEKPTEVVLTQGSAISLYNDSGLVSSVPDASGGYVTLSFDSFAFAGTPTTIYALPFTLVQNGFFQKVTLNSSGLGYVPVTGSNYGGNNSTGGQVVSDGKLLYTSAGQVWDPATQTEVGTFPVVTYNDTSYPDIFNMTLDAAEGEIYVIGYQAYGSDSSANVLSGYDMKTLKLNGALAFPNINAATTSYLVQWGTDGFGFLAADTDPFHNNLFLTRSSFAGVKNEVPTITSLSPTTAKQGGAAFTLTVTGTGFVQTSVVALGGVALPTTYVSATQVTAAVAAANLAGSGTTEVTVTSPAPGGGSSAAVTFTIIATGPSATLSANSLDLGSVTLAASSAAQVVTLTNSGPVVLSVTSIAATGNFSQTNTCGGSVAAGGSCTISVVFTPLAAGALTGSLTVTDNATGSPQSVLLSGVGESVSATSPTSGLTISSVGGTAMGTVQIAPVYGFTGAVNLSCSVAYQGSGAVSDPPACAMNPAEVQIAGTAPVSSTFTVTTTAASATAGRFGPWSGTGVAFAALLLFSARLRWRKGLGLLSLGVMLLAGVLGCSGSGGGGSTGPGNPGTTAGSYVVTVTATSGGAVATVKIPLSVQ